MRRGFAFAFLLLVTMLAVVAWRLHLRRLDAQEIRAPEDRTMFDSAIRSAGDLAGVFEFDGDTCYFYLYGQGGSDPKILGAIHVLSGKPDFTAADVSVRWDAQEQKVGLFIRKALWAVFDSRSERGFGGDYQPSRSPSLPSEATEEF